MTGGELDEILFANGQFVATGDDGLIMTSPDGLTWVQRHSPTDTNLRGIGFGEGAFIIVGNNQVILQSGLSGSPALAVLGRSGAGLELALRGQIGQSYHLQSCDGSLFTFVPVLPSCSFISLLFIINSKYSENCWYRQR